MRTPGLSTRLLLISLLAVTTIAAAILGQTKTDPALVVAAREGDFETVRALLAKRVNVNEQARDGATAILWAVHQSDLKMVRALVAGRRERQYTQPLRCHAAAGGQPHGRHAHDCRVAEGRRGCQRVRSS